MNNQDKIKEKLRRCVVKWNTMNIIADEFKEDFNDLIIIIDTLFKEKSKDEPERD